MRIHIDTHGLGYVAKFLLLIIVIFASGSFTARGLEEYFSPEPSIEIVVESPDKNAIYLDPPGEKPVFIDLKAAQKKKDAFVWEKRDFLYLNILAQTLVLFKGGVETNTFPIVSIGKAGSFFEIPGGIYKIQKKLALHPSRIEKASFPWSLNLFGNYLIHGSPLTARGSFLKNFEGGGIRLQDENARELFNSVREGTTVLIANDAPKKLVEFSYFRKTNLPHSVPEVTAASALAADLDTGHILFEKNKTDPFPTASVTKLLTALAALESIASSTEFMITREAYEIYGNSAGFSVGEQFSFTDLLAALILPSSNDAAKVFELAAEDFIGLMNKKAQELGMKQSFFADSSGLSQENVASAADLLLLLKDLYHKQPAVLELSTKKELTTISLGKKIRHTWRNVNWPAGDKRFLGGKAGWTEDSLQTMAGIYNVCVSEFCGRPVAIIVLGSRDRVRDVRAVISYLEKEFIYGSLLSENKTLRKIPAGAAIFEAVETPAIEK